MILGREGKGASGPRQRDKNTARGADGQMACATAGQGKTGYTMFWTFRTALVQVSSGVFTQTVSTAPGRP